MGGSSLKNIVGVRFKRLGKIYFFNPKNLKVQKGTKVIVETAQGEEYGEVVIPNRYINDEKIITPLKRVIRIANATDNKRYEECRKLEKEAFGVCQKKIKEHKLDMTLTEVECKFDNSKILFYFICQFSTGFKLNHFLGRNSNLLFCSRIDTCSFTFFID